MTTVRIGNICTWAKGYQVPRDKTDPMKEIPYLHYGDLYKLYGFRFNLNEKYNEIIKIDIDSRIKCEQYLNDGDIAFTLTSETVDDLGHCTLVINPQSRPFVSGMETTVVHIIDKSKVFPAYLNYLFQSYKFQRKIRQYVTGMKVYRVHPNDLMDMQINLPEMDIQKAIVGVLDPLSDKIYLNNKINDNLTAQIKTLINKEFPYNEDTCPEGWDVVKVSEVADVTSGYSYKGDELVDKSDSALVTLKNFDKNGRFKIDGYKPLDIRGNVKNWQYVDKYDIVIAHTDSHDAKIIGNAEIVLNKGGFLQLVASLHVFKVVPKDLRINNFLLAVLLKQNRFKRHCLRYVNGTTVLELSKDAVKDYDLVIPRDKSVIERCNKICKSIYEQMAQNLSESTKLCEIRDYILPKLMSGEIDVSKLKLPD